MPNRSADPLFLLVRSLSKSEKRNFKLYSTRNSSNEELKVVQLFDAMDKLSEYDEAAILKKAPGISKLQLSNTKALLYKQILASLRLLDNGADIDIQLHEQLDYARILYKKGLYHQSLKLLDKIKDTARSHNQVTIMVQVISLEKKIESLHITRSMQDRADQLTSEADAVNGRLVLMTQLSNLALQLYSWYIKNGHARNERDEIVLQDYFKKHLPKDAAKAAGFYEKLYLFQSYCWYAFIRHDFLMYYRYTQKWVDLFHDQPFMIDIDTANYIKGMHNLLSAHFDLGNYPRFREVLQQFEAFAENKSISASENNRIQAFVYLNIGRINKHFMCGTFREGVQLIPQIEEKLSDYGLYMDRHRVLVFYYKFASLYFGCGQYEQSIDYLNKIINWKTDLRSDLQCYARLLHLIAHYELGNYELLEYLMKSVYRFMLKMENISGVEEEIMRFLRKSLQLSRFQVKEEFQKLLEKLRGLERNKYETRAFLYLDIISWLESKVRNVAVMDVIRERFLKETKVL
ncbi:hypothetical protein [Pseudocnuella soli]|uniref:hypothetical protein n=1 Tax=Pseudocnuella soli TaxID=2502779 RepID=UPI00104D73A4|nr:hypothetical protein [Pseudocnuella soli]